MNMNLFGEPAGPQETKLQKQRRKRRETHNANGSLKYNPMIEMFGVTPGEKCKTCTWLYYKQFANKYYKCQYRNCTPGPASDHRVNWPACGKYEVKPTPEKHLS